MVLVNRERRPHGNDVDPDLVKFAAPLLAIENASEIARTILHAPGFFEKILEEIKKESTKSMKWNIKTNQNAFNIKRSNNSNMHHIILVSQDFGGEGHFGLIHADHKSGKIDVYDSMYERNSTFKKVATSWSANKGWEAPKIKSILGCRAMKYISGNTNRIQQVQPTGGFVSRNTKHFLDGRTERFIQNTKGTQFMKRTFMLSQFDEFSQHHFCYMESIFAIMYVMGLTQNPGPSDPRKRLGFIKKFTWAIIHKYTTESKRTTTKWKYFTRVFPYIITTSSMNGNKLRIIDGHIQVPENNGNFKVAVERMDWYNFHKIDSKWTHEELLKWVHS